MCVSLQQLIRKLSYLEYRYPWGSAFMPWLLTPGSMPRGGVSGQNLGHLKKWFSAYGDTWSNIIWSNISWPYDIGLCVMKWRSAWPVFHSPVILPYILKTIWEINVKLLDNWCDATFDLKINVGHSELYFMVQWLHILSWRLLDGLSNFWIMSQCNSTFDLKINIGHSDLYFTVQ